MDEDSIGPDDAVPEADAQEQSRSADAEDKVGLDTAYLSVGDRDANEADLIEQAYEVPDSDDDWGDDR
jgi:hypothetical protein